MQHQGFRFSWSPGLHITWVHTTGLQRGWCEGGDGGGGRMLGWRGGHSPHAELLKWDICSTCMPTCPTPAWWRWSLSPLYPSWDGVLLAEGVVLSPSRAASSTWGGFSMQELLSPPRSSFQPGMGLVLKVRAEGPGQWGWLQGCPAPRLGWIQQVLSWLGERDALLSRTALFLSPGCCWQGNPTSQPCQPPCPPWGRVWLAPCRAASPTEEWTCMHTCSDACVCRGAQDALVEL